MNRTAARFLTGMVLSTVVLLPLAAAPATPKVKIKTKQAACPPCNAGAKTVCVSTTGGIKVNQQTLHLPNRSGVAQWFSQDGTEFSISALDATAFSLKSVPPGLTTSCHWMATPKGSSKIGFSYKYTVGATGQPPLDPDVVIDNPPIDPEHGHHKKH